MAQANAEPTKDFFVRMITRDISLEDCILDLLDNSVDGASREAPVLDESGRSYDGYWARINLNPTEFVVSDNCGGISLDDAVNHAFRFGRRTDAPSDAEYGIGLYGIGMKRAIFKMGGDIEIISKTENESFRVPINVEEWRLKDEWDFDLEEAATNQAVGTTIKIRELKPEVAEEYDDPLFEKELREIIARDYSFIIQAGFKIYINDRVIKAHPFRLRESEDFKPVNYSYNDGDVNVEIIAGLVSLPMEDKSPEELDKVNVDYYGWFVSCNDRIVVAGSKSDDTVWGDEGFQKWHYQYNGFMGIVRFKSENPGLLPWTTTKREIDPQAAIYRRALSKMKEATRSFIDYSNARKEDLSSARAKEKTTSYRSISELNSQQTMVLPGIVRRVKTATIQYTVDLDRAKAAARALGNTNMAYAEIGRKTFKYYVKNEVEE